MISIELLFSLHVDLGAAAALVAFSSDDLVVVRSEPHALAGPSVEVVLHIDAATDTLALTNRPVLVEGLVCVSHNLFCLC